MKKLHLCSICGFVDAWDHRWSFYGSLLLEEAAPGVCPEVCSDECRQALEEKMKSGEIVVPDTKTRGLECRVIGEPVGYSKQPDQKELLRLWNEQNKKR